jgi:hypothetical protein
LSKGPFNPFQALSVEKGFSDGKLCFWLLASGRRNFNGFQVTEGYADEFALSFGEPLGKVAALEQALLQVRGAFAEVLYGGAHDAAAVGGEFSDGAQCEAKLGFLLGAQFLKGFKVMTKSFAGVGLDTIEGVETAFQPFAAIWRHAIEGSLSLGGGHTAETLDQDLSGSGLGGEWGGEQDEGEDQFHRDC